MALRKYFSFCLVLATYHTQVLGYNRSAVNVNQTIHVLQSSSVLLECDNLSANDKSKWKHGEDIIFIDKNALSTDLKSTVVLSQNYSLFISPTLLLHEGLYQCIRNSVTVRRYQVIVEVPPIVYITINGTNSTEFAVLEQEERFIARCYAERSKPKVNLTWKINNKAIKPSEYSNECRITEQHISDNVFDCVSKLKTSIQDKNGTIICTASAKSIFGERSTSVTFLTYRSKIRPTAYLLPVAFIILIPFIIVVTRFYLVSKQKVVKGKEDRSMGTSTILSRYKHLPVIRSLDLAETFLRICKICTRVQDNNHQE